LLLTVAGRGKAFVTVIISILAFFDSVVSPYYMLEYKLANICVTDIMHALSNEHTSWTQRVKLARYAWVSGDVLLPNKRQILMNVLMNAVWVSRRYPRQLLCLFVYLLISSSITVVFVVLGVSSVLPRVGPGLCISGYVSK